MSDTTATIPAGHLDDGDTIVNVGTVDGAPLKVGAFVVVTVTGHAWSVGTGRQRDTTTTLTLHLSDDVVVVDPGPVAAR